MVKGLDIFRVHFQDYADRYVLIGGTACDIAMTGAELAQAQADPCVHIWLRVQVGGEAMSELARELGYANGSGVARVVERLEATAQTDGALAKKLAALRRRATA